MRNIVQKLLLVLVAFVVATPSFGVLTVAAPKEARSAESTPASEPMLAPGPHLGMTSFVGLSPDEEAQFQQSIDQAIDAGLDVARLLVDWSEIETAPGAYDLSSLESQMARFDAAEMSFMLSLVVTDTDRYTLPNDLQNEPTELAQPLDDPAVVERYLSMLDHVLPAMREKHPVFVLSVANEPDNLLSARPETETTALGNFLLAVRSHMHNQFPGIAVTLTLTTAFIYSDTIDLSPLIAPMDVLAVNWGCLEPTTFAISAISDMPALIDRLLAVADGRDIVFQEISCASGWSDRPSGIGASPEFQRDWFAAFFDTMANQPTFRAAFVLDAIDWPEELTSVYGDAIRAEGLNEIGDNYQEFLATWGLFTYPNLEPKPAWDTFLSALSALS